MTNSTSYTFECNRAELPVHLKDEPKLALHLTVSEDRIVIRLNSVLTDDAGVVYDRLAEKRVITLHVNASGKKYLRAVQTDSVGREHEWAFDVSRKWVINNLGMPFGAKLIFNDAVCKWLGSNSRDYIARENGPWAFYPALRTLPVWKAGYSNDWHVERLVLNLMSSLSVVECRTGRLRDALTGNSDWNSFICDVIKETTDDSIETMALIVNNSADEPSLLEIAALGTGRPFSKLCQDDWEAVRAYAVSFSSFDKHAIHFMLEHLPEEMKADTTQTLLLMINAWKTTGHGFAEPLRRESDTSGPFVRVPEELQRDLALELYKSLKNSGVLMKNDLDEYFEIPTRFLPTQLQDSYHDWFYEIVFQPSIASDASKEDVIELHKTLFGVECSELEFYETDKQTTFCHLRAEQEDQPLVIFATLATLIHAFPESKESSLNYNEYVDAEGCSEVMPQGAIYSPDDMVAVLKLGAETVDRALNSLDREITPDNRCAYLTLPPPLRDHKNSWRYYDLGVKEPGKISALRKACVTDVDEITPYAQLPDEMFYEIIGLRTR